MTQYFRIHIQLEYRITSLVGRMLPYISDEVFPVFLLVEQTPAELIVVALTQLDYQGEDLMDIVIDTLEQLFVTTLRCFFDKSNILIHQIDQIDFYKELLNFGAFINREYTIEEH